MASETKPQKQQALRRWAAEWKQKFDGMLEHGWPLADVAASHDELDRIASAADGLGDAELAAIAVELSVYLCSFVEAGRSPDANQRANLQRMSAPLGGLVAEASAPVPLQVVTTRPSKLARLLCVSGDTALIAELSLHLAEREISMIARADADDALQRLPEHGAHLVLVDHAQLIEMHRLERAARSLAGNSGRPLFVALLRDSALEQRMYALRGGADQVLEFHGDTAGLVEHVARLLRDRDCAPLRAMIIDDDRSQAMFCESVLRHAGVETSRHTDVQEALDAFAMFRPEVVLLDLYMPVMDGMATAAQLRTKPDAASTSIIFLSGDQDAEIRFQALAAGGDDFLTKPILPRHLVAAVLSRGRRARQLRSTAHQREGDADVSAPGSAGRVRIGLVR